MYNAQVLRCTQHDKAAAALKNLMQQRYGLHTLCMYYFVVGGCNLYLHIVS